METAPTSASGRTSIHAFPLGQANDQAWSMVVKVISEGRHRAPKLEDGHEAKKAGSAGFRFRAGNGPDISPLPPLAARRFGPRRRRLGTRRRRLGTRRRLRAWGRHTARGHATRRRPTLGRLGARRRHGAWGRSALGHAGGGRPALRWLGPWRRHATRRHAGRRRPTLRRLGPWRRHRAGWRHPTRGRPAGGHRALGRLGGPRGWFGGLCVLGTGQGGPQCQSRQKCGLLHHSSLLA